MKTKTGNFPIGFRRGWSDWQKDLDGLIAWTTDNDLEVMDVGKEPEAVSAVRAAGLRVGSADLFEWQTMISPDKAKRDEAVGKNTEYIRSCTADGGVNFFIVMLPEDPALPAKDNFGYMVEAFGELTGVLEDTGSTICVEGWPGPGSLVCTPETFRAFFEAIPSASMAVNYDPSHLMRMNIDPLRFLKEFAGRVAHVHGKDTELMSEKIYECGTEIPPVFAEGHGFGAATWRYTIPGQGQMDWRGAFAILADCGYAGGVSIELEDENFNGAEATEKEGILQGAEVLKNS